MLHRWYLLFLILFVVFKLIFCFMQLEEARGLLKHIPGAATLTEPTPAKSRPGTVVLPTSPTITSAADQTIVNGGSYYRPRYVPHVPSNLNSAKSTLHKALRIHPQYSEACYLLGVCCMYESDLDNAVKHIQRSILMDPFYVDAYFDLANINMRLCKYELKCFLILGGN